MKIVTVVGARPNFMKVAPVHRALVNAGHTCIMVHTGQHYDAQMSEVFFRELGLPEPAINLQVGSGSHAAQTARIMERFEPVVLAHEPEWVLVAGDVNSTLGCALVTAKLRPRLAHLEAGVRSYDRSMPEEINRLCVDQISDLLLTPGPQADANLRREGIDPARIHCVGNVMIDSLLAHLPAARLRVPGLCERLRVTPGGYVLATVHRAANVDDGPTLDRLIGAFGLVARHLPVLWIAHPRTQARLAAHPTTLHGLAPLAPLGYLDFLALQSAARIILTDSGGVQEESTALGVPCLTLRENTEWLETVEAGTNTLVGTDPTRILAATDEILRSGGKRGRVPPLWDGSAASRVVEVLARCR